MSKALSTTDQGAKAVRRLERKVIKRTQNLIERGVLDASKITDEGFPVGEDYQDVAKDPRRLRIAMDMRQAKRDAPAYLEFGLRRIENAEKLDAAENIGAPVALNMTVNIVQAPKYEVIDVTPTERR